MRVGIVFGGKSGEHEISLMSATSVINAIDKVKYEIVTFGITKEGNWLLYDGPIEKIETGEWEAYAKQRRKEDPRKYEFTVLGSNQSLKDLVDVVFPVLHGPFGEDGTIQGLLEMIDIPYVGCHVLGSSLAMDKIASKKIFEMEGLPICKYAVTYKEDLEDDIQSEIKKIREKLPYPMFIKPANLGSSVGISKAKNEAELKAALLLAAQHDRRIVVEEGVDCREIEVGVIGNARPKASAVGEIVSSKEFYDFEAKYFDGGASRMCIPAPISEKTKEEIRTLGVKAYMALDLKGFSRVDFFIERKTGQLYLNEINTIPGFTKFSMFPSLWKEAGMEYAELIDRLIDYGMASKER